MVHPTFALAPRHRHPTPPRLLLRCRCFGQGWRRWSWRRPAGQRLGPGTLSALRLVSHSQARVLLATVVKGSVRGPPEASPPHPCPGLGGAPLLQGLRDRGCRGAPGPGVCSRDHCGRLRHGPVGRAGLVLGAGRGGVRTDGRWGGSGGRGAGSPDTGPLCRPAASRTGASRRGLVLFRFDFRSVRWSGRRRWEGSCAP